MQSSNLDLISKPFPCYTQGNPIYDFMIEGMKEKVNQYSRPQGIVCLVEAAAKYYSIILRREIDAMTEVMTIPGYKTALTIYCCSFLKKRCTIIALEPLNPEWMTIMENDGFKVKTFPVEIKEDDQIKEFEEALSQAELFIVPNAGIITGKPLKFEKLEYFASLIKKNEKLRVISDEGLNGYCNNESYTPLCSFPGMEDRVSTLVSADAEFEAEGTNISFFITNKEEVDHLFAYQIWNFFSPSSIAMVRKIKVLMPLVCCI